MPQQTQAEMFIQTLTEMRDEEHERRKAGLNLDAKAHVQRFMKAFRTDPNASDRPSEWTLRNEQMAQTPVDRTQDI